MGKPRKQCFYWLQSKSFLTVDPHSSCLFGKTSSQPWGEDIFILDSITTWWTKWKNKSKPKILFHKPTGFHVSPFIHTKYGVHFLLEAPLPFQLVFPHPTPLAVVLPSPSSWWPTASFNSRTPSRTAAGSASKEKLYGEEWTLPKERSGLCSGLLEGNSLSPQKVRLDKSGCLCLPVAFDHAGQYDNAIWSCGFGSWGINPTSWGPG